MKAHTKTIIASAIASMAILAGSANATVLFSDDFTGSGSGTGFAAESSWSDSPTISGGELSISGTSFRDLGTGITTATMDFWFVANLSLTSPTTKWGNISFYAAGIESAYFGADTATANWEFDTDATGDQESSVAIVDGAMTLLIAHITSDSISMWIDPTDTSSIANLGAADKSITLDPITSNGTWNRMRIGSSGTITVESMIGSTDFHQAIPEPSSAAFIISLGALALILRRRK
jgi:hypothetical protein